MHQVSVLIKVYADHRNYNFAPHQVSGQIKLFRGNLQSETQCKQEDI